MLTGTAAALAVPLFASAAVAADTPGVTLLSGSRASFTETSRAVADTPAATPLSLTLDLRLRDAAGAEALAAAVSDPSSAQHGAFLSPAEYAKRFAATDASVRSVVSYLTSKGVHVTATSPTNRYVSIAVTAAKAESLFGVDLKQYEVDGKVVRANAAEVKLPTQLAPLVGAVQGLTQAPVTKSSPAPPSPAFVNSGPCSTYFGEKLATTLPTADGQVVPYAPCGYVPSQLRSAYDVQKVQNSSAKIDGRGVTVAIVDAYNSPTILADANTYATRHGDKPFAKGQFSELKPASYTYGYGYSDPVNGDDPCGESGWYGEETLDVEAVHGLAPGAKVLFSGAASCQDADIDMAVRKVVDGHLASIISNSYGDTGEDLDPASIGAQHATFVQAAIEGIGVYFSSGDNGDETANTGSRQVDYPASDPFVTAVGGTSIGIDKAGKRSFETGWSTGRSALDATGKNWTPAFPGTYQYGGGGGVSQLFAQPSYQQGVVPASISEYFGGQPGRAVPDVSAIGDPNTGMLVGQTQTFPDGSVKYGEYRIGGTSLASPVVAGIMALGDQIAGRPRGFANYFLYDLAGTSAYHDSASKKLRAVVRVDFTNGVDASGGTTTTLRSINDKQSIFVRKGYDDVTGVGQPNGTAFLLAAAGVTPTGGSTTD
ncbi:S53 family peptidase [Kineococcus rubinsiae]|uniref:S53 family peptidase n=1 Tax=Kineococcus rubinsiae TaxID=2609562 RepID=UPI00142F5EC7|nr:S53 family peptidase [Kineococcus rubinsiae]NIZ91955.1 S8/S53 family peptidase [Kineococcus rubinsiae]